MIDRSRGGSALQKLFTESFEGVLITDFWRAYDGVCADGRQFCLVHLLRELEKVDERHATARREAINPQYETNNPREAVDTSLLNTSSHGAE